VYLDRKPTKKVSRESGHVSNVGWVVRVRGLKEGMMFRVVPLHDCCRESHCRGCDFEVGAGLCNSIEDLAHGGGYSI
jgi:hypothetical protein